MGSKPMSGLLPPCPCQRGAGFAVELIADGVHDKFFHRPPLTEQFNFELQYELLFGLRKLEDHMSPAFGCRSHLLSNYHSLLPYTSVDIGFISLSSPPQVLTLVISNIRIMSTCCISIGGFMASPTPSAPRESAELAVSIESEGGLLRLTPLGLLHHFLPGATPLPHNPRVFEGQVPGQPDKKCYVSVEVL